MDKYNQYKELLENALSYYYMDDEYNKYLGYVPKSRYDTFNYCLNHIHSLNYQSIIVELGTSRSFVDGRFPGCNSSDVKYWESTNPIKWDWSAGHFTRIFSECTPSTSILHTVDLESEHIERCKIMTQPFSNKISYHVASSEDFLHSCKPESIDLLYLDTGDVNPVEPTAQLHLREAMIIVKNNILRNNGLILIDDVKNIASIRDANETSLLGKAKYSIPFFLKNGYILALNEYQVVLKKST